MNESLSFWGVASFLQGVGAGLSVKARVQRVRRSGLVAHLLWKMGNQRPHGWAHRSFRGRPMTGSSTCWSICPRAWYRTRPFGQTPSAPTGVSGGPRVGRGWTSREPGQADSSRHSENSPQTRAGHWINNFPHPRLLPPSLPRGPGHVTREGGGLPGVWPSWCGCYGLPWWLRGKESACQCRRRGFDPWVRKIPCLAGCSPRGLKESDRTERPSTHAHQTGHTCGY